jgi:mRNA-degrading endonuclease YafQ of YafQ-DinJ toxin-antitoxin module
LYNLEIEEETSKTFRKLLKKNRKQLEAVNKIIQQILTDPYQFKPLKHPLEGLRRLLEFHLIFKEWINYNSGCLDDTTRRTVIVGRTHDICMCKKQKTKKGMVARKISPFT